MKTPKHRRSKIVAIHEAGHAVVAAHLGLRIKQCTILPMRGGRLGHTKFLLSARFQRPVFVKHNDGLRVRSVEANILLRWRNVERLLLATFAGLEAQVEYSSYIDAENQAHADERVARLLAIRPWRLNGKAMPGMPAAEWTKYRARLKTKVEMIIRLPYVRSAILSVAKDLLTYKTLSERHVKGIYAREKIHHGCGRRSRAQS